MPPDPEGNSLLLLQAAPAASDFSGGTLAIQIVLLLVLILLNAFFAMSEIAIVTLNDNKIRKMAEDGHKGAAKVLKLTKNNSRFLSTIQIGVTLSGFLTSASAAQTFAGKLAGWFVGLVPSVPFGIAEPVATVVVTLILSYFSLVLGELVPKKIAMQRAEEISFKVAGILNGVALVFSPFIRFLSASTNLVIRLLGFDPNASEENVTEEEILMMVDVGEEKGVIEGSAKDMIANIFDFDDIDISPVNEAVNLAIAKGYSRIPVYHEDIDDIVGVVYVKDLLKYVCSEMPAETKLTDIMRTATFIPETKKCSELFAEMTASKNQMAIIVDEYGGTEGLITMEDLVEAIVGNIQDEYDQEEDEIRQVNDNTFTVDGTTSIDEISELIGIELPEGEYDTIAGLLVENLGRIPRSGEHPSIAIDHVRFTVDEVEDRRITRILIVKEPADSSAEETFA